MNGTKEKSAKLAKLQSLKNPQIGGKGTTRRKKKVVHKTATTDDKKLQNILKKHNLNSIPGIEEVNMIKDDGNVIHFTNPKVQASLAANTFAISGNGETKSLRDLLPGIHNQLVDYDKLSPSIISAAAAGNDMATDDVDDEVPNLIENFDVPSQNETT